MFVVSYLLCSLCFITYWYHYVMSSIRHSYAYIH